VGAVALGACVVVREDRCGMLARPRGRGLLSSWNTPTFVGLFKQEFSNAKMRANKNFLFLIKFNEVSSMFSLIIV
jgi:hypothetical protein